MNTRILFFLLLFGQMAFSQVVESSYDTSSVEPFVEFEPEFNGGFDALIQYITANLEGVSNPKKKRAVAKEDLFEGGRVLVRFIIEKDGKVSNVVLEERLRKCEPCNREAIRVVKNMPKWKPGSQNGRVVRTYVRLPIRFVVD